MAQKDDNNPHLNRQVCGLSMNLFGVCCILAILLTLMLFGIRNNILKQCGGSFNNESGILMPQVPDVKSGAAAFWAYKMLYQGVIPYLIIGVATLSLLYIMFLIKFRLIPSWWRAQKDIRILDEQILTKKDSQGYGSLLKMLGSTGIEKKGRLLARFEELEPIYQRFKKQEPVRDANDRLSATDEAGVAYCLQPLNYAIWILPILGFIGTVLGVTGAIDGLRNGINTLFAQMGLTSGAHDNFIEGFKGLALAFDTTLFGLIGLAVVGTIQFFLKKSASFVILTIDKKVNEAITLLRERDPLEEILKHFFVTNKEGELELGQDEKPVLRWQEWMDLLTRGLFKTDKNGDPVEGDDKQPVARLQDFIEKGFFVTDNDGRLVAGDDALPILRFQKFIETGLFVSEDGQITVDSLGKPVLRWQQWMDLILDDLFFNYKNQNEDHIHVSKTEQYRRQILQILIRAFYEVTEDKAEEIAQGYIDGRDEPVPLQSQFERRHRQTYSLLASTAFLVEKSTTDLEKIEEMIEEAVTGDSDNNTTARKNRSHWGARVLQSSNTPIETIALDDRHFVVSREVEGSMGEYELVTGVFQLSPGGRHIQPVAGDSFTPPEKVTGITIQGSKFICACDGSRSIVGYDFTGNGLPDDIGFSNAGTFYPNAISVMSHDEMTQVVVVTEEKGSAKLLVLPIDGSAPSPSTVASMQGDLCAVALQGSTSIVCTKRTKWPDVCRLTIVNVDSGPKIKEFSVQLSLSCMTYDLRSHQNLLFGTDDGKVGIINIAEERILTLLLIEEMKAVDFMVYTAAGQMIACKRQDNRLAVIDLSSNNPVHMIECDKDISALSCSATGNHLLVGCIDGSVYHWDVRQPI